MKKKLIFSVDNKHENAQIVAALSDTNNTTNNTAIMLEDTIAKHTEALLGLTEAIKQNTAALATINGGGNNVVSIESAKEPAAKKEAKAPAKEEKKPAAKKADAIDREALRKLIVDTRAHLTENVSPAANAKHKEETRKILTKFGATSITDLADDKITKAYEAIKAIDVNPPDEEEDGGEDDL